MSQISIDLPVNIICGSGDGPTLLVTGGMHGAVTGSPAGAELGGTFGILKMMRGLDPATFRGTLVVIPVVNTSGFEFNTRDPYWDRKSLSPSSSNASGSVSERLSYWLYDEIVPKADAWLDIHSGGPDGFMYYSIAKEGDRPQAAGRTAMEMAAAFGLPDIAVSTPDWGGGKRGAGLNIPKVTPEMGGGADMLHNGPAHIETCAQGIRNVMTLLGMLDEPILVPHDQARLWRLNGDISNGPYGGIMMMEVTRGQAVRRGQTYAAILHPYTGEELDHLVCPTDGTVINSGIVWPAVRPYQWLGVLGEPAGEFAVNL
ncbi:MAG: succinylglutamate desuccinylase/aspartoacylase family protein [Thermaerobacterales bacterium]